MSGPTIKGAEVPQDRVTAPAPDDKFLTAGVTLIKQKQQADEDLKNPDAARERRKAEEVELLKKIEDAKEKRAKEDLKRTPPVMPPPVEEPKDPSLVAKYVGKVGVPAIQGLTWVPTWEREGKIPLDYVKGKIAPVVDTVAEFASVVVPERIQSFVKPPACPNANRRYAELQAAIAACRMEDFLERLQNYNPFDATSGGMQRNFDAGMKLLGSMTALLKNTAPELEKQFRSELEKIAEVTTKGTRSMYASMGFDMVPTDSKALFKALGLYSGPISVDEVLKSMTIPVMARERLDLVVVSYSMYDRMRIARQYLTESWGGIEGNDPARIADMRYMTWKTMYNMFILPAQKEAHARMLANVTAGFASGADGQGRFTTSQFTALTLLMEQRRRQANQLRDANTPNHTLDAVVEGYLWGSTSRYHNEVTPLPDRDAIIRTSFPNRITRPLTELSDADIQGLLNELRSGIHADDVTRAENNINIIQREMTNWVALRQNLESFSEQLRDNPPAGVRTNTARLVTRTDPNTWGEGADFATAAAPLLEMQDRLLGFIQTTLQASPDQVETMLTDYTVYTQEYHDAHAEGQDNTAVVTSSIAGLQRWFDSVIPRPPDPNHPDFKLHYEKYKEQMALYESALSKHKSADQFPSGRNGIPTGTNRPKSLVTSVVRKKDGPDRGLKEFYDRAFYQPKGR